MPVSSAAKIKRLIRPLLKRNPDLVLIGKDTLWLSPIHKFGRHIHFKRGNSDYFTLSWHLTPLFTPALCIAPGHCSFYDGIGRSHLKLSSISRNLVDSDLYRTERSFLSLGTGLWEYDDHSLSDDLILQIDNILRLMRSLDTLQTCIAFSRLHSIKRMSQIEHWPMILDLIGGDLDAAREIWSDVRDRHRPHVREGPLQFHERIEQRWSELDEPLMEKDASGLAVLLNRWESENVHAIGVENYWHPTEFPFEI